MKITDENGRVFEGSADELKGFGFDVELQADGCVYSPDEEVLSAEDVKEGDYFVITDNKNEHNFAVGEVVKAQSYTDSKTFKAEYTDGSDWWFVRYTSVRRATAEEIAEATKPKEVKFEVGDVVEADESFAVVTHGVDSDGDYRLRYIKDSDFGYKQAARLRHATEEEKSHLQTLIGREKDEYKVGDLVELLDGENSGYEEREGYIFEVDSVSSSYYRLKDNGNKTNDMDTYIKAVNLKLITPVEYRHDFVKEAN